MDLSHPIVGFAYSRGHRLMSFLYCCGNENSNSKTTAKLKGEQTPISAVCDLLQTFATFPAFSFTDYLLYSVADPDSGSGAFLTPGSEMGKKFGSGMKNPDHISECLTIFLVKILKFFEADPSRIRNVL